MVKDRIGRPPIKLRVSKCKSVRCDTFSLQCSDSVGSATGRAFGLQTVRSWFVCDDDLTGALLVLVEFQLSPNPNEDILLPAYPG